MAKPNIIVKKDEKEVIEALCKLIETKCEAALSASDGATFNIGLSGGSMAKFLCEGLPKIKCRDWARWRLFFCDERLVPEDNSDSTWGVYKDGLCKLLPLSEDQFLRVKTDLEPEAAAKDYEARLRAMTGMRLDLLLLGAGPDGHTCSLFPGHPLLSEPEPSDGGRAVAHISDSPKPPPHRVTLTLPVVNSASCCVFAAVGQGKADMMKKLLGEESPADPKDVPARMVRPRDGELVWLLDTSAAQQL